MRKVIVVLPSGWVLVGDTAEAGVPSTLGDASVIRRWDAGKGLGHLAQGGPAASSMTLSPCNGVVTLGQVLFTIECVPDAWAVAAGNA